MGDSLAKMIRKRNRQDAKNAARLAIYDAENILDRALDRDEEMTLEMMDDCRNYVRSALSFFDED